MKSLFITHFKFHIGIKRTGDVLATFMIGLSLLLCLFSQNTLAHNNSATDENTNNMAASASISNQWARATFALAKTGAAYFSISNKGESTLVLVSVSVSPNSAMSAEFHHTIIQNDMMQMQELSDGVKIQSGETLDFSPGGKHIMLMGLTGPLTKGEAIVLRLHFDDGSYIEQTFPVLDKRNKP